MRKNPHSRILREEPEKQHLSIVPKSCSCLFIYLFSLGKRERRGIVRTKLSKCLVEEK